MINEGKDHNIDQILTLYYSQEPRHVFGMNDTDQQGQQLLPASHPIKIPRIRGIR